MAESRLSLQRLVRKREQDKFVGRVNEIHRFQLNLRRPIDDPNRYFIFNVFGVGGIGKTCLLERFNAAVTELGGLTAYVDESQNNALVVMDAIAGQLAVQGHKLDSFVQRYKTYRQLRQELVTDPEVPPGLPALLGRVVAKGGWRVLTQLVPGIEILKDFVDGPTIAATVTDFSNFIARKISNKDEIQLVLEPVSILTQLFIADLWKLPEDKLVALAFDTYEFSGEFLDAWLRNMLDGNYGDSPPSLIFMIAGQSELDRNLWNRYDRIIDRMLLSPFSDAETREYLDRKGIADERVVATITSLSKNLPLLVAILATSQPDSPGQLGDPSGNAVDHFLKWVQDAKQKRIVLDAALPRQLNRDILGIVASDADAYLLFDWLKKTPFVKERGSGWVYYDLVRTQMLRYKFRESPHSWATTHQRLAEYYESLQDKQGSSDAILRDQNWQAFSLESIYHRLCQSPRVYQLQAISGFMLALKDLGDFAYRWVVAIKQAGEDTQSMDLTKWGTLLETGLSHLESQKIR
jgi:hypothetical protein